MYLRFAWKSGTIGDVCEADGDAGGALLRLLGSSCWLGSQGECVGDVTSESGEEDA